MSASNSNESLSQLAEEARNEPLTMKDRIIGFALAVIFVGVGASMWLWPMFLSVDRSEMSGRRGRSFAFLLDLAWSRPVGAILILLGLLVLWGTLFKKNPQTPTTD